MSNELDGKRIAFLVANSGVEQVELTRPWDEVKSAGGQPVLLAPEKDQIQAVNNDIEKGDTFDPDLAVGDADVGRFDALVLPGGLASPDKLRLVPDAVSFVRDFAAAGITDRGDLPRPVDARRGRRRQGKDADQLAEPADRYP